MTKEKINKTQLDKLLTLCDEPNLGLWERLQPRLNESKYWLIKKNGRFRIEKKSSFQFLFNYYLEIKESKENPEEFDVKILLPLPARLLTSLFTIICLMLLLLSFFGERRIEVIIILVLPLFISIWDKLSQIYYQKHFSKLLASIKDE